MDFLTHVDWASLFSFSLILIIFFGVFVGILIGSLPGLGATIAIVLLLPITYALTPIEAVILLLSAYQGAEYGGSISSIILGIPGTPAAVATIMDGHPLSTKHSPGKALGYSLTASLFGGITGGLVLIFLSIPLAKIALQISAPEFFLVGTIGLIAVAGLSSKNVVNGLISATLGLMAGTVGMDMITGAPRYTFGNFEIIDGLSFVALLVGVFAITEIFNIIQKDLHKKYDIKKDKLQAKINLKEFKKIFKPTSIGSILGSIIGVLPGVGSATACWFAYDAAKRTSKDPDSFGEGNPEGIAAPEASNNAVVGSSLVPLLALGIPGSGSMAIIMGAFIIHGVQPGPRVFSEESSLVYSILVAFLFTTVALFIIGKLLTPVFASVLNVPNPILMPIILMFAILGAFASKDLYLDIWIALITGIIFYFFKMVDYSFPSFVLGFVLSPIIEENFRRALIMSDGSYLIYFTRPYSIGLIVILLIFVSLIILSTVKKQKST